MATRVNTLLILVGGINRSIIHNWGRFNIRVKVKNSHFLYPRVVFIDCWEQI